MKKVLLIFAFCVIALGFATKAKAKGIPIPFAWGDEKIMTVVDLPNDSTSYNEKSGKYMNIGYFYKQVWLVWIPLWNYDGQYCGVAEGDGNTYYTLPEETVAELKAEYDLPANPISFWNKMGGKLIVLALVAFMIWGQIPSKKKEEEEEEEANGAE